MPDGKKETVCKKVFHYKDGERGRSAQPDAVALTFNFANGETIDVQQEKFTPAIQSCLMWNGISQKLGDAYAGAGAKAKETGQEPADVAFEMFGAMLEQLELGTWVTEREATGPRLTILFEAIVAAKAKAGEEVREDTQQRLREDKDFREAAAELPAVKAEALRISAERAAARAAAAATIAAGTEATGLDMF